MIILFWYIKPQNWKMVYFSTVALLHNFKTILSPVLSPNCTTWAIPLKESFWFLSIPVASNKKTWAFSALPPPSPRSVFWHCHQISRIRIAFIWISLYTQTRNLTHPCWHPLVTNHPWYFSPPILSSFLLYTSHCFGLFTSSSFSTSVSCKLTFLPSHSSSLLIRVCLHLSRLPS